MSSGITVCIPSIPPRREWLARALESVALQTLQPDAIVVSIDNDKSGAAANRNRALRMAQTEWVAFLDDDDVLYPQHLERLHETALWHKADVVYPWFDTDPPGGDPFPELEHLDWNWETPHIFPITTLVRRELAIEVGGFPEDHQVSKACSGEDFEFWKAMGRAGAKVVHLRERTWVWHHHGQHTSGLTTRW